MVAPAGSHMGRRTADGHRPAAARPYNGHRLRGSVDRLRTDLSCPVPGRDVCGEDALFCVMAFAWTVSRSGGRSAGTAVIRALSCAMACPMSSEHSHGCEVLGQTPGDEPGATVAAPEGQEQGLFSPRTGTQGRRTEARRAAAPRRAGASRRRGSETRSEALAGGLPPLFEKRGERRAVPAGARALGGTALEPGVAQEVGGAGRAPMLAVTPIRGYRRRNAGNAPRRRCRLSARSCAPSASRCAPSAEAAQRSVRSTPGHAL